MPKSQIPAEHQLYRAYSRDEDTERSKSHYEQDPRFYYAFTGGEWNVYSGVIWPNDRTTITEAQEAKLDLLAECMQLKPGMRILDVGCGWGGPLTYLCKKYGVSGIGVTVSPRQREAATARAARYGVDARFVVCHWEEFEDPAGFDAIYTDEVIVHFNNLSGFFARCWNLLHMGGRFVNKELHYTHQRYANMDRAMEHVNAIFGYTGNYRILADELRMLNDNGFEFVKIHHIPMDPHYFRTADVWLNNMFKHQDELKALVGDEFYSSFRKYLKIVRRTVATNAFTLDVVVSKKIDPNTVS